MRRRYNHRAQLPPAANDCINLQLNEREVQVDCAPTIPAVLDAIELHSDLRGTMRDPARNKRRAFVRFVACQQDLSHDLPDTPVPPR